MSQDKLDTEALVTSTKALAIIEEHTRSCDAKYATIERGNRETHNLINKLFSRFWQVAVALVALLLSIIGYLLTHNISIT